MVSTSVNTSAIQGSGVFSNHNIREGKTLMSLSGKRITEDEADTMLEHGTLRADDIFQVQEHEYLVLDELPVRINHSCNPNTGLRVESELIALRDIGAGEEITYDYSTVVGTNNDGWIMHCNCGDKLCRKEIESVLTLPPERLKFYRSKNALPDFILKELTKDFSDAYTPPNNTADAFHRRALKAPF